MITGYVPAAVATTSTTLDVTTLGIVAALFLVTIGLAVAFLRGWRPGRK